MTKQQTSHAGMNRVQLLQVAISLFPPLVMKNNRGYTGFEIELWEKIAAELGFNFNYTEYQFPEIIPALQKGEADIGLAGITRTEEREKLIDFSHFTLESGLRILISKKNKSSLLTSIKSVLTGNMKKLTILFLTFVIIAGHLIWLTEKGGLGIRAPYIPGIFDALWWSIVTVSTVGYGDIVPVSWAGRILGALIILVGFAIFGMFIAQISSSLTVRHLGSAITNHRDLHGKSVATVQNTTSVPVLKKLGARLTLVQKIDEAYRLLEQGKVMAVAFDAPVLLYYVHNQNAAKLHMVGGLFESQTYGMALQSGSHLLQKINQVILRLRETGAYDALYKKWFGEH